MVHSVDINICIKIFKILKVFWNQEKTIVITKRSDFDKNKIKTIYIENKFTARKWQYTYATIVQNHNLRLHNILAIEYPYWVKHKFSRFFHVYLLFVKSIWRKAYSQYHWEIPVLVVTDISWWTFNTIDTSGLRT